MEGTEAERPVANPRLAAALARAARVNLSADTALRHRAGERRREDHRRRTEEAFGREAAEAMCSKQQAAVQEWDSAQDYERWLKRKVGLEDWQAEREEAERRWQQQEQADYMAALAASHRRGLAQASDQPREQTRPRAERGAERPQQVALQEFLVDNSALGADAPGVAYRLSRNMQDKDAASPVVPWGAAVWGVDQGDGWIQVGKRFLPLEVQGAAVLVPQRVAEREGEDASGSAPAAEACGGSEQLTAAQQMAAQKEEELQQMLKKRAEEDEADAWHAAEREKAAARRRRALDTAMQEARAREKDAGESLTLSGTEDSGLRRHHTLLGLPQEALATRCRADEGPGSSRAVASRLPRVDDVEDYDFDFAGDGRPFRFARGRASRVCAESGPQRRDRARLALAQLRGSEPMQLALRGGFVRHVGPQSPFGGLGESGGSHRLAQPELRARLRDFVVGRARRSALGGAGPRGAGLRYASLGSGRLLLDLELLERLRLAGVRVEQVCLVDRAYRRPSADVRRALREFADWQRAAAEMLRHAPAEVLVFGTLGDYYEAARGAGRAAGCHLLVQCDAHWRGAPADCERLALRALVPAGLLVCLTNRELPHNQMRSVVGAFAGDSQADDEARDFELEPCTEPYTLAAWEVQTWPAECCKLPSLVPIQDPLLSDIGAAQQPSRPEAGGDRWRVVHARVAVRSGPSPQNAVVDVFNCGDEVVAIGEAEGGWLRLCPTSWSSVDDAPPEAWVLSDGSSVGLGALLRRASSAVP
ncbi:unnamed protein product [Prorocentrum cordatum]|uniref:SH3 domain-containing protein n=1 Tax=Prorocentrum cordatum TaxID=2364126 RepID=A0ABN9TFX0_9DINO|nr:unnamed protein product [Polarella glacialis]